MAIVQVRKTVPETISVIHIDGGQIVSIERNDTKASPADLVR